MHPDLREMYSFSLNFYGHRPQTTNYKFKFMYILLTVLIVIAAILITLLVLVQNSKGGGLAAGFNSGNQVMGVRKTTDFLEKATWTLIALIVLLSIFAVGISKHSGNAEVAAEQSAVAPAAQQALEESAAPVPEFGEESAEE